MKKHSLAAVALLVVLSLLVAIPAFAEAGVAFDGAIEKDGIETPEGAGALGGLAQLDLDGAALVSEDVKANDEGDEIVAKINKANFPAADFRNYVLANIDANGDRKLSRAEAEAVTRLMLRTYEDAEEGKNAWNISTLKGVEYFSNLVQLECHMCNVKELDVTKNTRLEALDCEHNRLAKLDVSKCPNLDELRCRDNRLTKLDLSKCRKLTELDCSENQLKALNVTRCPGLEELKCSSNKLTKLDLSKCRKLKELDCSANQLSKLNASQCTALEELFAWENKLTALNVSKCKKLEELYCQENQLDALNVTNCPKLEALVCGDNPLKKLNITKNTRLEHLNCFATKLTALDVSKCRKLKSMYTWKAPIKTIDLKNCPTLRGYIKNGDKWTKDDFLGWKATIDGEYTDGIIISASTTLTNGKTVLYKGK